MAARPRVSLPTKGSGVCPECGFDRKYKAHRDKVVRDAVAKAVKKATKRIKALERDLAAERLKIEEQQDPPPRDPLVDIEALAKRTEKQREIGWAMAQITFDDFERIVAEIMDLRSNR